MIHATPHASSTPWTVGRLDRKAGGGPELLFGRMYEDAAIEAEALAGARRVFCIASAGCTTLHLASLGHHVTAVDINPRQTAYIRERLGGAPFRPGWADRLVTRMRRALPWLGMPDSTLSRFASLDDTCRQRRWLHQHAVTKRLRLSLHAMDRVESLRCLYRGPFLLHVPDRFAVALARRLWHGFATYPNRSNPHAQWMLRGVHDSPILAPLAAQRIDLLTGDAAEVLESMPAGSIDGFSLSNILDGAPDRYAARLAVAVRRAAAPQARCVIRSIRKPRSSNQATLARRDRSMLWGTVIVATAAEAILRLCGNLTMGNTPCCTY